MTERTKKAAQSEPRLRLTLTEYAILGLLVHVGEPRSGYDLRKLVDESIGFIWQPSKTQLYAVLARLVGARLATARRVRQEWRPDKTLYAPTAAGRAAVRAWLERDEDERDPDRSVFVLKLFFGAQAEPGGLDPQLAAFRDAYARRLALYEAKLAVPPRRERASDAYTRLTLRYGIVRARAAVEWADAALAELRAQSAPGARVRAGLPPRMPGAGRRSE
ncbi:MAG TPA: PadR family transcriptional regulator [Gaiellaceae bacterium]|nr:PadR family transcriptional regulator [Gaiellaceae bacterium]